MSRVSKTRQPYEHHLIRPQLFPSPFDSSSSDVVVFFRIDDSVPMLPVYGLEWKVLLATCSASPMYSGATLARPRLRSFPLRHPAACARHRSLATTLLPSANHARSLKSILIANRGEIALSVGLNAAFASSCLLTQHRRVGRTAAEYGIRTTVVYTDPDAKSQHASSSPFSVCLGNSSAYLDGEKILRTAQEQGCTAIHPGYGFVSLQLCRHPARVTYSP